MKILAMVLCAVMLSGCSSCGARAVKNTVSSVSKGAAVMLPEAPKAVGVEAKTKEQAAVDAANDRVAVLEGDLAKAKAERDQKEDALRKARYASLRKLAFWVAGIAFLATCVAVAAAFFLPVFKRQLLMGAAACVAVIAVSLSFEAMLPYIPWIGGAIVVGLIAWLILALMKSRKAIKFTAAAGDLFANAVTDEEIKDIKKRISAEQIQAGVKNLIQDARGKLT